ncbi:hypothetical protein CCR94_03155 [Rhodoblastus sphagnicola]|uniref:Uncharacterized protein n=2 Tax=Rhodoblastus sphagnicola TaxID=333368 RepID=A0A2S6NED7_9HYPH|nr:hypothetical protein CCR94_03155 [Rhodoblastus sphagnicola]
MGLQTNEVCVAATDSILGAAGHGCAIPVVTRQGDALIVTIACGHDDDRDITSLLFTGDFQSWYRAQSRTTSGTRHSGFTIDARFLTEDCDANPKHQSDLKAG